MKDAGFTLLEVMVALVIIGFALTAAVRAAGSAVNGAHALKQQLAADWVAQNRIVGLQASDAWPPTGETQGSEKQGSDTYYWKQVVAETPNPLFRKLDVEVSERQQAKGYLVRRSGFLIHSPVKSDTGPATAVGVVPGDISGMDNSVAMSPDAGPGVTSDPGPAQ